MTPSLLIVCTANVCRSPAAAVTIDESIDGGLTVRSAGARARSGDSACAMVRRTARRTELAGIEAHRSRPLTTDLVESATLTLAMTEDLAGAVIRLLHRSRSRVFTLAGAATIGAEFVGTVGAPASVRLAEYATFLDDNRRILAGRPSDISDGHGLRSRKHHRAIDEARGAARAVATQILGAGPD